MRTWCEIARIVATKNLDGGLVVKFDDGSPFFTLFCEDGEGRALHAKAVPALYAVPPKTDCPRILHVCRVRKVGDLEVVVHFAEIQSADIAHGLVGCHLLVDASVLPKEANFKTNGTRGRFTGWTLADKTSGIEAKIVNEAPAYEQILLTVKTDADKDCLVPLVDEFIVDENPDARTLVCRLPRGLFDL